VQFWTRDGTVAMLAIFMMIGLAVLLGALAIKHAKRLSRRVFQLIVLIGILLSVAWAYATAVAP
jgi:hypothetical protein